MGALKSLTFTALPKIGAIPIVDRRTNMGATFIAIAHFFSPLRARASRHSYCGGGAARLLTHSEPTAMIR
jgi:hypothetical protein